MRVVLYADDMEPITVLELEEFAIQHLKAHGHVRLTVPVPPRFMPYNDGNVPKIADHIKSVSIYAERFVRRCSEHTMLFTGDDESALLLKCAFLPGQQAGLRERERQSFANGVLYAISRIGM